MGPFVTDDTRSSDNEGMALEFDFSKKKRFNEEDSPTPGPEESDWDLESEDESEAEDSHRSSSFTLANDVESKAKAEIEDEGDSKAKGESKAMGESKGKAKSQACATPDNRKPKTQHHSVPLPLHPPVLVSAASQLKRSLSFADLGSGNGMVGIPSPTTGKIAKPSAHHDPENHEIKRLRDMGLSWGEIAEQLNKQRIKSGRLPGLTENAIYSRYMRNAPKIAAAKGQQWTAKQVGNKLSGQNIIAPQPLIFKPEEDEMLVRAYKDVMDDTWKLVSERIVTKGGPKFTPESCARRYHMI